MTSQSDKREQEEVSLLANQLAVEVDESDIEINRGWTIRTWTWDEVP